MSERETLFVDVILPVPIANEFTYRVPFELNEKLIIGGRVIVPFGNGKLQTAIVTKVHQNIPSGYQTKYVEHILDDTPIITQHCYKLWQWMSRYYMSPIGDVMNAALPSNFKLASETKIVLHPDYNIDLNALTEREKDIVVALDLKKELDLKEISEIISIKTVQPVIKKLIEKRIVITLEELNNKFTPKTVSAYKLTDEMLNDSAINSIISNLSESKGKRKQYEALMKLIQLGEYENGEMNLVSKKELESQGASLSSLNTLEKNKIVENLRVEISRFESYDKEQHEFKSLSEDQEIALNEVNKSFAENKVALLHGVTGSGKTEIYVQLIQEQLDQGKQVLFLLPEIALTTQLITRLASYFGDLVGVYHSKFNQNEKIEIWNHVLTNNPSKFRIILGARSSVFLPFNNLGLVIVDEEHESSFKQYDPSPRYNARDTSIVLSHLHKANVILGSATPSLESYYNAKSGKYNLIELDSRFGNIKLPEVLIGNIKKERQQKSMQSHFTSFLIEQMKSALEVKEQIILFQNRRGYNPYWMCEICNWTPQCVNCDVSLTYHKQKNNLNCHYCGYSIRPVGECKACGSNKISMLGFGTEKIEDELKIFFPDKVSKRLDLDTTRSKNAYAEIISDFDSGKIDILIGTQMISKGLDFENVNLVGILDADMLLKRPDFRAFERSFQLMTQVAGRSGRRKKRGTVVIQTGDPDNWVIEKVINHDFIDFYKNEIIERNHFFYPPFFKVIEFTLRHKDENKLNIGADRFSEEMRKIFKERVLGPEFPLVKRVQNYFIKKITLKFERDANEKQIKERINQILSSFYSAPNNKSIRVSIDVDPA